MLKKQNYRKNNKKKHSSF